MSAYLNAGHIIKWITGIIFQQDRSLSLHETPEWFTVEILLPAWYLFFSCLHPPNYLPSVSSHSYPSFTFALPHLFLRFVLGFLLNYQLLSSICLHLWSISEISILRGVDISISKSSWYLKQHMSLTWVHYFLLLYRINWGPTLLLMLIISILLKNTKSRHYLTLPSPYPNRQHPIHTHTQSFTFEIFINSFTSFLPPTTTTLDWT